MASSAETIQSFATARRAPLPVGGGREPERRQRPSVGGASLAALVESEIIPRLMLAHAVPAAPVTVPATIGGSEVDAFAPLALDGDARDLLAAAERLMARGVAVESIMVDLLAPAARQLGIWWEEDRCDFVEVTMGLWRLQEVLREVVARGTPPGSPGGRPRRALFVALPGDQHDFGATLVGEMFHRHGWDVDGVPGASMPELLATVGQRRYDLVGLTVSCDSHSALLPSAILALRSVSLNPRLRVMVGGRLFAGNPALADEVGADGTAPDARAAVAVAETLVDAVAEATAWS